ncbi:olfactory receptor class A-like protein 1 [Pleurodeles waltl]|uniref:olfactory receptor class A-like protein 1 n=1 Tax=Pleurodeles waltl TaxID=8319 RepID=UPI003709AEB2
MSICLTCFLSCFQCVTIMSTSSTCMSVRLRLQANVGPIILFLLIMNGTMCIAPLLFTVSGTNVTNLEYAFRVSYCIVILPDKASLVSNNFILFARDFVFVTGMSVASGSMLFTLYKHRKQVKGIRSAERTQALCAEVRASKMVSALVALYVLFFGIDNSIWFYQNTSPKNILTSTSEIRSFFSVCYASVFPFIIVFFSRKLLLSIRRYTKEKHHISKGISAITIAK